MFEEWMERLERVSQTTLITVHELSIGRFRFHSFLSGADMAHLGGTPDISNLTYQKDDMAKSKHWHWTTDEDINN
jgi:hypothetical protein